LILEPRAGRDVEKVRTLGAGAQMHRLTGFEVMPVTEHGHDVGLSEA
jgi:hypothetical protein